MTKYDIIFESLQMKVETGELTIEDAQILNDVAFEKYGEDETEYEEVTESYDDEDEGVTYEEYLETMEEELFGEATRLSKEIDKKVTELKKREDELRDKCNKAFKNYQNAPEGSKEKQIMQKYYDKYHHDLCELERLEEMNSLNIGRNPSYDRHDRIASVDTGRSAKYRQQEKFKTEPAEPDRAPGKYDLQVR